MNAEPRTSETLRDAMKRAMAGMPGAHRGSLLVRDGDRLVYRAAIGLEDIVSGPWQLPAYSGATAALTLLAGAGATAGHGLRMTPAVDWYRAHLPGFTASLDVLPAGAGVAVLPIHAYGEVSGALAIETATTAPLERAPCALLEILADVAGATLEREGAYREMVRSAHELDLIQDMLSAVASSVTLHELARTLGDGLKRVQPHARWSGVELVMTAEYRADDPASQGGGEALEKRALLASDPVIARAMSRSETLVIDLPTSAQASEDERPDEAVAVGGERARTRVVVPLLGQDAVLGALVLESQAPRACSADDLTLIERVANTVAVLVENARLIASVIDRSLALEQMGRHHERLLQTVQDLSCPVVPIARDILVLPVIGVVDERRAGRFMESMLAEIYEHAARVVLIDVTGMVMEDARSLNHLEKAARAARLLGVDVAFVGVSARIANTMVAHHLDIGGIVTRSSLKLGLVYALARIRARVVRIS